MTVVVPKELLRGLVLELSKVEEVLATLEELLNEEGLKSVVKLRRSTGEGTTSLSRAARKWRSCSSEQALCRTGRR